MLAVAVLNDMLVRNIGIVGYAVVLPVAVAFLARLCTQTPITPAPAPTGP
jgi:hypothetical protein